MSEALERAKSRTLKEISQILRNAFWSLRSGHDQYFGWRRDRDIREYAKGDPERTKECEEFFDWCMGDFNRLQEFIAKRSPSTAAALSLKFNERLCPAAEKIVKEKAKDKPKLLEYCGHWGIVLGDMAKVTLNAAFGEGATREKAYIKKIEYSKKKAKEFLEQMVAIGQLDSSLTLKELLETL